LLSILSELCGDYEPTLLPNVVIVTCHETTTTTSL
jgi:hypothetical protein